MEKKYKRQNMDADEARELLYDIRDGRVKYEEVDWGDETIKEVIKDTSNPKNSDLISAETINLFKSVDTLVEESYPHYEAQHPLFEMFGTRTGGICDTWLLNDKWKDYPEELKWKYVALCNYYWLQEYKKWDDDNMNEINKLKDKIFELERKLKEMEKK